MKVIEVNKKDKEKKFNNLKPEFEESVKTIRKVINRVDEEMGYLQKLIRMLEDNVWEDEDKMEKLKRAKRHIINCRFDLFHYTNWMARINRYVPEQMAEYQEILTNIDKIVCDDKKNNDEK